MRTSFTGAYLSARAIVPAYEPNGAVPVRGPGEKRLYQDGWLATPEPARNVVT
jgi:hypothetical protein